jgi:hypothetical protein
MKKTFFLLICASLALNSFANAESAPASAATATKIANLRIAVTFQKVDSQNFIILKYGSVLLKTKMAGLKIKPGASGVLGMLLPDGASLQAEIVEKGNIQSIILWKGKTNLNEQLLINGVAEGIR